MGLFEAVVRNAYIRLLRWMMLRWMECLILCAREVERELLTVRRLP